MYVITYHPDIELRTCQKVKMKIDLTDKERVRRSPFYACNQLWDKLNWDIQTAETIVEFGDKFKCIDNLERL